MNEITHVNQMKPVHQPAVDKQQLRRADQSTATAAEAVDRADISELGRLLALADEQSDIRADKVAAMRSAIAQDEERFVKERLDGTVNRLIDELLGH